MDIVLGYLPFIATLAVAGVAAGIVAGLLGIGGGTVMVPAMALVLGILGYDPAVVMHVAVGTSLAVIIPTGLRSAQAHARRDSVDFTTLWLWAPVIAVASLVGGLMAGLYTGDVLRLVFGVVVLLIALNSVFPVIERLTRGVAGKPVAHRIAAAIVGYISALMGIGGGALSVPTLTSFGLTMHRAVGTASAIGVVLAVPAALGFVVSGWSVAGRPPFSFGYINLPGLVVLGVMAALFAPVGAAIAHKLPARTLKIAFAVYLLIVGVRMLWQVVSG
ncbi:sulfite exporter TauE/SafE family protein [Cucumibacter marinus]|uniref:sulfite exporter TauE/SafE family protein n=1 Tax=Cucumibacter marinus TaxID=1121252 RepID=UPI0003FA4653|nr:sulfite exporter TauE/SafE family protein [Cucumibacter marinus]